MKNVKFEQSFNLYCNNKTRYLKTLGKDGLFLVDIRMRDTHDIKNEQWWQKINGKGKFL